MRRNEKAMTTETEIMEVIRRAEVCRLGLSDEGQPYIVPMNFGYADGALYLHAAPQGRKLEIVRKNNRVCVEFEADAEVVPGEKACNWTMRYKSVIAVGEAFLVEDTEEKLAALRVIMDHYTEGEYEFAEKAVARTLVIKVVIKSMSGKKSGY